jgi:hypothetical protein
MSAPKVSLAWSVGFFATLASGLVLLFAVQTVSAQRTAPRSSCWACHATEDPVVEQGEWHTIHALQKCCRACHGGNDHTTDQAAAHAGMTFHPLDNAYLSCQQCHPDDFQQRAGIVAVALGITPGIHETAAHRPRTTFQGWDWPVELAVAIVALGLGVMRWRRVHSG